MINFCSLKRVLVFLQLHARDQAGEQAWLMSDRRKNYFDGCMGLRKLQMIEAAENVDDLREPPSNKLEALKGDRKGYWSIRINGQWRIIFRWVNGYAENVEIIDYH